MKSYAMAQDKIDRLYALKVERLNFNHGKTSTDTHRLGGVINLMSVIPHRAQRVKRAAEAAQQTKASQPACDI